MNLNVARLFVLTVLLGIIAVTMWSVDETPDKPVQQYTAIASR